MVYEDSASPSREQSPLLFKLSFFTLGWSRYNIRECWGQRGNGRTILGCSHSREESGSPPEVCGRGISKGEILEKRQATL